MARSIDKVRIELIGDDDISGSLDNFTSFMITNDVTSPSEGAFETGNDGSWDEIIDYIKHGTQYRVFLNDRTRLTGRIELNDIPVDTSGSSVVRFTIRTKLADAAFAGVEPGIRVKDTSIKDFLLALYAPLGYTESDFNFDPYTARDLISGYDTSGQGDPIKIDLDPIKIDQARVNPPETIFAAADRHLRRHGLMHWDSADGRILVSAPNDSQEPFYSIRCNRNGNTQLNNVEGMTRAQDFSGIPSLVAVFGTSGKAGKTRSRIGSFAIDFDVQNAGFYRPITIQSDGIRTQARADRASARELSSRSKRKDCFDVQSDGLSHWDGESLYPWAVDMCADITSDVQGGKLGSYYIHRVVLNRNASAGDVTNLSVLRSGIWKL